MPMRTTAASGPLEPERFVWRRYLSDFAPQLFR